ncbi:TPA: hypothetical protein RO220_003912 [Escherichia coli]|nr:hypothetical protein [Escherichia coli]
MSFTDNWSDEEFIRQMKELIGNEGDIHVTCNHSEGTTYELRRFGYSVLGAEYESLLKMPSTEGRKGLSNQKSIQRWINCRLPGLPG